MDVFNSFNGKPKASVASFLSWQAAGDRVQVEYTICKRPRRRPRILCELSLNGKRMAWGLRHDIDSTLGTSRTWQEPTHRGHMMIHGYHVILPMYGFWLPNDPRGSWSDFVRKWELVRFGAATKSLTRREVTDLTARERRQRDQAKKGLEYDPVSIDGHQARAVGRGFARQVATSNYTIWACSILPEHTHLVIARHTYEVEQIANLLKGAATRQIIQEDRHPLAVFAPRGQRPPRMWAAREWKVYLDTEEAIDGAIDYVVDNPSKEDKPLQNWPFVTPFAG